MQSPHAPEVAYVLGGGGVLGAAVVGMLQALDEAGAGSPRGRKGV